MGIENLTHESLTENLNTKFRVTVGEGEPREIELIEVSEQMRVGAFERFSAIFRGATDSLLPQGTYSLEHERLGACELFLVPIAREADGFRYEAVFNRFAQEG
ncbi:MAG: DUF6916 family protein [Pyrinomonadaceae bacterium]